MREIDSNGLLNSPLCSLSVPPRKVIIKDERGLPLHDLIGPYDEESNLRILCQAEGGLYPSISIKSYEFETMYRKLSTIVYNFNALFYILINSKINQMNNYFMSALICSRSYYVNECFIL